MMYTWVLALICIGVSVEGLRLSSPVTVTPGSPTTIKCTATGVETGVVLTSPSGVVYRSQDTNRREIVIQLAAAGDDEAGEWTCTSVSGSSTATTKITLQQRISARVSHEGPVTVGGVAVFTCEVRGNPLPTATWFRGSTQINQQTDKYAVSETVQPFAKFNTLQVQNVQSSDAGIYSCRADNGGSMASGSAYLSVSSSGNNPVVGILSTQKPRLTKATTTQRSGLITRLSSKINYSGPSEVGQELRLDCKVTGPVDKAVMWYKNFRRIYISSRIQTLSSTQADGEHSILVIKNAVSSDTGQYMCQVRSGFSSSRSSVSVSFRTSGNNPVVGILSTQKPRLTMATTTQRSGLITRLSSKISYSGPSEVGQELRLDCKVTGPAGKTVMWFKNSRRIYISSRIQTLSSTQADGEHSILVIKNAVSSDTGQYMCQVRSGFSSSRSSVGVSFRTSGNNPVVGILSTQKPRLTMATTTQRSGLITRLSSKINYSGPSEVGQELRLDCKVTGPAGKTVMWFKNSRRIYISSRIQTLSSTQADGEHSILVIKNAVSSDTGQYMCQVRSGFSSSRSSVGVSFRGSGGAVADPTDAPFATTRRPFSFQGRLSARLSPSTYIPRVGDKLTLDCKVTASEGTTVTLTKDSAAVVTSMEIRADGKHYTYTIDSAKQSDTGRYVCEVRGQSGSVVRSERRVIIRESLESSRWNRTVIGLSTAGGSVGVLGFLAGLLAWWKRR